VPLSRDEVIAGALALLDEAGLDELSMRNLARSLGVQAGAIYWHFKDRQDLEDAMVEALFHGLQEPAPRGRWQEQISELCRRMAAAMLARRDGARLALRALRPGPETLGLAEAMMAILRKAGLPQRETLWLGSVVGYYVIGYVSDVQATEAAKARGLASVLRGVTKKLQRGPYPELRRFSERGLAQMMTTREMQARFEYGLSVILKGATAVRRRPRRKR
jgi:TetR/AcrR family tetracycline transcriptional repressor